MNAFSRIFRVLVAGAIYACAQSSGATPSSDGAPAPASASAEPIELTTARSAYTAGVEDLHTRVPDATAKRTARYVSDLKLLANQVAATGNLDAVLLIKAEREAYEGGKPTKGFDAADAATPAAARQLRAAYDTDLDKISKYAVSEERTLAQAYVKQLADLERRLTIAGNVDGALAARSEKIQVQGILDSSAPPAPSTPAVPLPATPAAPASPAIVATAPDFKAAAADYQSQQAAIDAEIQPKLTALHDKYEADLAALASRRPGDAAKLKGETKRFDEHGLNSEPAKNALPEIRSLWSVYVHDANTIHQSVTVKRDTARSRFGQTLMALEFAFRKVGNVAGTESVKRARAALVIDSAVENDRIAVSELAGKSGGEPWQDLPKGGGYLIGIKAGGGSWFQFHVLGGVIPVFATVEGTRDGKKRGSNGTPKQFIAKDGYAVGGIIGQAGDVVDCIQVIFMRINPDGLSLNPQDSYNSEWIGGNGKGQSKDISARGHLIVGVTGKTGDVIDSLAYLYLK